MRDSSPVASSASSSSSSSSRAETPNPEDVAAYEALMADRFGFAVPARAVIREEHQDNDDAVVIDEEGGVRPMTKAEKQNAKKKRRKEREKAAKLAQESAEAAPTSSTEGPETYEFRLFSSVPMGQIAIRPPNEDYPVTEDPRHLPLPAEQQERIRRIAQEAAVEYSQLGVATMHDKWTRRQRPPRPFISNAASQSPPALLHVTVDDLTRTHQPLKAKIPSVDVRPVSERKGERGITRRGRRRFRTKEPIHRFYAPPIGLGGKARGYAWGWRDSMEGRREVGHRGYIRSKGR